MEQQQLRGETPSPEFEHCIHNGKRRCLRHCHVHRADSPPPLVGDVSCTRPTDRTGTAFADIVNMVNSPSSADSPFSMSPVLDMAETESPRATGATGPHVCRRCPMCRKMAGMSPRKPCLENQGTATRPVTKRPMKASFAGGFDRDDSRKHGRPAREHRQRLSKGQQNSPSETTSGNSPPPMMSPGAVTVLNIDAALSPKGPKTRLPDNLPMGRFQLMILACAQLSAAVDAYQILSARLLAPPVDHWCRPPAEYSHMSADIWKNVSVPLGSNGRYNQCAVYEQARTFLENCFLP
ncbi:hypothetical protein HPB52_000565 [Rhipicephalus sanguineus]|uniref:Uncharacterized protein n=1 Tax=Rhipicephalus sanguineus TaxID=34632 RepID=A0A9D4QDR6_RHISA|nr:hypothetical protein HPB52_000565 [Rhipicephalus sanguineus]